MFEFDYGIYMLTAQNSKGLNCGQSSAKYALQNTQNDCHQWFSDSSRMQQIRFRPGLCPEPRWGSLRRSPDPLLGWGGGTSILRKGKSLPIPLPPRSLRHLATRRLRRRSLSPHFQKSGYATGTRSLKSGIDLSLIDWDNAASRPRRPEPSSFIAVVVDRLKTA